MTGLGAIPVFGSILVAMTALATSSGGALGTTALHAISYLFGLPWWLWVKNQPATWETWVRSLGWEEPLEKEVAAHSSVLAWRIPWTEEPGGLQTTGSQRVRHD